ncbi:MAG: serine--tRNA ligase [candidate division WOR-3 bacterium]
MNLKFVREHPEEVRRILELRRCSVDLDRILSLDTERKKLAQERDKTKFEQRQVSEEISRARRIRQTCDDLVDKAKVFSDKVKQLEATLAVLENELETLAKTLPNRTHESVTAQEEIVDQWGEIPKFNFQPLAHWDLGEALDIVDLRAAARLAGSRFIVFKGLGALLERALIAYFLDRHTRQNGYAELAMPVLANPACMEGAGQLPHLESEMYAMRDDPYYLIPTSETMLANLHREQTLEEADLPKRYVTYSPCFRREAGSYGKDVRGMIRVHQFDKVEIFRITRPEASYQALEEMRQEVESLVRELGLPYRVKRLAAWDIAYQSAKTYDIEVWAAGVGRWLEVSSISNCEDYQMRRTKTRLRTRDGRMAWPHALNGSGLALPRTFIAIIENFQQPDGSVIVPAVLRPYMNGLERIA